MKLEIISMRDRSYHVSVCNTTCRDNTEYMDAIEYIENPNTCVVHWVHHLHTLCPPEQKAFSSYEAPQKC